MAETSEHLQTILSILPDSPGVYQYFDDQGQILYVGKAKNLKNRVSSYFSRQQYESGKTMLLVRKIADIQYTVVETEMDALLLENALIKKYKPRYNINLKDDKTYPSIVIKKEDFPRIFATRQIQKDGSEYHGPYASVRHMHAVLDMIRKMYPIRSCSLPLTPENIEAGKFKVCLEYHIGNCLGPCEAKQTLEAYRNNVEEIRQILKGDIASTIKQLRNRMTELASQYHFEHAQELKEKIDLLDSFQTKSTIVSPTIHNVDVFTISSDHSAAYLNFMKVNNGTIVQSYSFEMKKKMDESDAEILGLAIFEIRQQFQSNAREVLVSVAPDIEIPQTEFIVPQRGDKKKLLDLSLRNSHLYRLDALKKIEVVDPERHQLRVMETLQKDLRMQELPMHIECFDNSNIQGTNAVSACVVFRNAKPSKSDYRIFNVKTVDGPDDFSTMREAVFRRYSRLLEEGLPLPQLIIIDGGKGQLSVATETLEKLGLRGKITIIGIAKRLEEIYFPSDSLPLYLDKRSESLKLIQQLRDEAHRFGLSKHRNRRSKDALQSELTSIAGVGAKSAEKLIAQFRSVDGIRHASIEDLTEVLGASGAQKVFKYFRKD